MNKELAREVLLLYRPGTPDEQDPEIIEALQVAKTDPELASWLKTQQALTVTLRTKLKSAGVPEGLKEQILSECKPRQTPAWLPSARRLSVPWMAAALLVLLGMISLLYWRRPADGPLAGFRDRMARIALREYPSMDLETSDPKRIRDFLRTENAYGDYVLPPALEKATATGCAILSPWRGRKVSMLCFSSGQQRDPNQKSDLFLFIIDRAAVPDAPAFDRAKSVQVNAASSLSWSQDGKTYLLVADGDEPFLRKFY